MKRFALAGALLALAVPTVADAKPSAAKQNAKAACKELRSTSKAAFKAEHGNRKGKKAWAGCMREWKPEAREARSNAAQDCKAERAGDPAAFKEQYGTNKNKSNAFGKCVSSKAKAQVEEQVEAEVEAIENAAKQCKAERDQMGEEAFREQYGTNKNKRNAFGKCVSQKAQEQEEQEEQEEAPAEA